MRISDWSSDVCSSGWMTKHRGSRSATRELAICFQHRPAACQVDLRGRASAVPDNDIATNAISVGDIDIAQRRICKGSPANVVGGENERSEEHTSELQSLMRISYAVFCLTK